MTKRNPTRILIIGCGIAGPTLAMFLRRVGNEVLVCEARPEGARGEGAFLGVAPNGMNVLADLGVHADVERVSVPCHGFEFQNARGQRIGGIDRSGDQAEFGARLQMVRRTDLQAALTDAARTRGVDVQHGRKLTAIHDTPGTQVIARFADGSEEHCDALLGCDGIRSRTRQLVLPAAPDPAYTGLMDFAGFADCPEAPLEPLVNVMVFGRRAFFGAFKTQTGEIWWFHNSGEKSPEEVLRDPEASRARILELHRQDPEWIRDVVAATPAVLGPYALHDILTMPRWSVGRVCLVGDAAHATTPSAGQGASMALEDAMVLAQCLRDADLPEHAFMRFEQLRRARVEETVKQSRRYGSNKAVSGPVSEWFRDRMLPFFLRLGAKAQTRQYRHRIEWQQTTG